MYTNAINVVRLDILLQASALELTKPIKVQRPAAVIVCHVKKAKW